jgi:hypothetical protein
MAKQGVEDVMDDVLDSWNATAEDTSRHWVPFAVPTSQFNYWVVLPSHLSPVGVFFPPLANRPRRG